MLFGAVDEPAPRHGCAVVCRHLRSGSIGLGSGLAVSTGGSGKAGESGTTRGSRAVQAVIVSSTSIVSKGFIGFAPHDLRKLAIGRVHLRRDCVRLLRDIEIGCVGSTLLGGCNGLVGGVLVPE